MKRRTLLQGSLAGCAAFALPGCATKYPIDANGWKNARGTTYVLPRWQWAPTSAAEIVTAVQRAETEGHRIRMTGSGHSFSDVAANEDWLLSPRGLTQILQVDTASLQAGAQPETLVRVQSGLTIQPLNRKLEKKGLALENMGGAEIQTYVGAASTGTHGSGFAFGPLASQIVSIQIVGPGRELWQIEPTQGITNPAKFPGHLLEDPSVKVALHQADDLFNAAAVSLGSLGVIYAVTFRAVPKYWLIERRTLTTWEALAQAGGVVDQLLAGEPIWPVVPDQSPLPAGTCLPQRRHEPDHVEIYYTPYADEKGKHTALLTQRWRTNCKPPGAGGVRGTLIFTPGEDFTALADHLGLLPALYPRKTVDVRKFHQFALENMVEDYYANISYDVFSVGVLNDTHTYGIEVALDASQTKQAVAQNFALAQQLAAENIHHSSPPALRFVNAAPALLAMQNGRKTTMMEIGVFTTGYGSEELLRSCESVLIGGSPGARPHWGLDRNYLRSEKAAAALYPVTWARFKAALATLNPHGTFDGNITDRLGLSVK